MSAPTAAALQNPALLLIAEGGSNTTVDGATITGFTDQSATPKSIVPGSDYAPSYVAAASSDTPNKVPLMRMTNAATGGGNGIAGYLTVPNSGAATSMIAGISDNATARSFMYVFRRRGTNGSFQVLSSVNGGAPGPCFNLLGNIGANDTFNRFNQAMGTVSGNAWHILTLVQTPTTGGNMTETQFVDGVQVYTGTNAVPAVLPAALFIGTDPSKAFGLNGDMVGMAVWNSALTQAQRQAAEGAFAAYTGIPVSGQPLSAGNVAVNILTVGKTSQTLTSAAPAGGTAPYTYQWYRSTTNGTAAAIAVAGNALAGATALTLNDSGLTAQTAYYYVLKVTDSASNIALSAVTTAQTHGTLTAKIGFLGDSITFGTLSTTDPATEFVRAIQATYPQLDVQAVNYGHPGEKLRSYSRLSYPSGTNGGGAITSFISTLQAAGITYVGIMEGTNDWGAQTAVGGGAPDSSYSASNYKADMQDVIAALTAANMTVYVNQLIYRTSNNADDNSLGLPAYNAGLAALSYAGKLRQGDTTAYAYFKSNPGQLSDGLHPLGLGSIALGQKWAAAAGASIVADLTTLTITPNPLSATVGRSLVRSILNAGLGTNPSIGATTGTGTFSIYTDGTNANYVQYQPPATGAAGTATAVVNATGYQSATLTINLSPALQGPALQVSSLATNTTGTAILAVFNQAVTSAGVANGWAALVNGQNRAVTATVLSQDGLTATLNLASAVAQGQSVTLSFNGSVQTAGGTALAPFNNQPVTNNSLYVVPKGGVSMNIPQQRPTVLERIQVGLEGTPGVAAAALTILSTTKIMPSPEIPITKGRTAGSKTDTYGIKGKEWTVAPLDGEASYCDLAYLLSMILCQPVASTPAGASATVRRVYRPQFMNMDQFSTYTVQRGNPVSGATQFSYGYLDKLDLDFTTATTKTTGEMIGQTYNGRASLSTNEQQTVTVVATGGTFTLAFGGQTTAAIPYNATAAQVGSALQAILPGGAYCVVTGGPLPGVVVVEWRGTLAQTAQNLLTAVSTALTGTGAAVTISRTQTAAAATLLPIVPFPAAKMQVWMGSSIAGLTQLSDAIQAKLQIASRFTPHFTADDRVTSFTNPVEKEFQPMVNLLVEKGSDELAYIDALRSTTTNYLRIVHQSDQLIEAGFPYRSQLTIPVRFEKNALQSHDELESGDMTLYAIADPALGWAMEWILDTGLASLS